MFGLMCGFLFQETAVKIKEKRRNKQFHQRRVPPTVRSIVYYKNILNYRTALKNHIKNAISPPNKAAHLREDANKETPPTPKQTINH